MVVEAAEEETPRQASPPMPTSTSPYCYPAHTPPSQYMGMGADDWRPHNDKEPFSFSAFPSLASSSAFAPLAVPVPSRRRRRGRERIG